MNHITIHNHVLQKWYMASLAVHEDQIHHCFYSSLYYLLYEMLENEYLFMKVDPTVRISLM